MSDIKKIAFITFALWVLADQGIRLFLPKLAFPGHFGLNDERRNPSPYIEFKGKPNVQDHNAYGYRWDVNAIKVDPLKIAFYGGSTGYAGDPPIAKLLESKLEKRLGTSVQIANFSVVSSQHRQHLHNMLETFSIFKPDITIFYGGYNEIAQAALYDPRPGYPYNYFYRAETPPLARFLLEHSTTIYLIDEIGRATNLFSLTPIQELRADVSFMSDEWKKNIVDKYFETLFLADMLARSFHSYKCQGSAMFRFFYQPYMPLESMENIHSEVKTKVATVEYGYDVSSVFDDHQNLYKDNVHVLQEGNDIMASAMAEKLLNDRLLKRCFY